MNGGNYQAKIINGNLAQPWLLISCLQKLMFHISSENKPILCLLCIDEFL
jgi:hypothetical protein